MFFGRYTHSALTERSALFPLELLWISSVKPNPSFPLPPVALGYIMEGSVNLIHRGVEFVRYLPDPVYELLKLGAALRGLLSQLCLSTSQHGLTAQAVEARSSLLQVLELTPRGSSQFSISSL